MDRCFTGGNPAGSRESSNKRTENIIRFHDDPDVRLFFATDAGGVGLNLQKAATICINLELPWNPAVLEQRIGRIYRLGQDHPIQVFNLVTQGTIEERITELVAQKRQVFNALFDGTCDEVVFDSRGAFYTQVQKIVNQFVDTASNVTDTESADEIDAEVALSGDLGQISDTFETDLLPVFNKEPQSLKENQQIIEDNVTPECDLQTESLESKNNLSFDLEAAFKNMHIEKTESGGIKIEAEGESANILVKVFKGMAQLFESAIK